MARPLRELLFHPILAGATLGDRAMAAVAATIGIALTGVISGLATGRSGLPLIAGPIAASAVLVFAVPSSPLAQPWPLVGGNVVSAAFGVLVARLIGDGAFAAGVAVGGSILLMSVLRCLHPPGGAAAMGAVLGGPAVASAGFLFPFVPVGLNALLLLAAGWLFHRFSRHRYPHRPAPVEAAPSPEEALHRLDIALAIDEAHEAFDVSREDLEWLLQRAEHHAALRRGA